MAKATTPGMTSQRAVDIKNKKLSEDIFSFVLLN